MGNLSEHYSNRDFSCRCGECRGQVRIHLGLVGALEAVAAHFRKVPHIHDAFRCELYSEKHDTQKKNSHRLGKAAHISIDGVDLKELYAFAKSLPEVSGIGYYPQEKTLHIDTREPKDPGEKEEWVKENGKISPVTPEIRSKYGI
ncbi:MAG: DUF882 domain-containing protein [Candidatus Saganbacteria bacterium]|nr:DUF882 domain-containing protein [Candidatus Saganbacteria bacterium]